MKKTLCGLAVLAALISNPAFAHKEGDVIVRLGLAAVAPNESSGNVLNTAGTAFELDTNAQIGLTLGYMLTDNVSIEVLAATPFKHSISTNFTVGGNPLGEVAETKHLPPTFMLQYYFGTSESDFRPYVGAGINYTLFFDEELNATGTGAGLSDLSLDNSWGLAANLGMDYKLNEDWFVNASVWYADIDTTATYKAGNAEFTTDVQIDPWVFMLSAGYKF